MNFLPGVKWSGDYDISAGGLMGHRFFFVIPSLFLVYTSFFLLHSSQAQDSSEAGLESILRGFDDSTAPVPVLPDDSFPAENENSGDVFPTVDFSGAFSHLFAYAPHSHTTAAGFPVHGLTNFKTRVSLGSDIRLSENWFARISGWAFYDFAYLIQGYDRYSSTMLDNFEDEIELGETFLQGRLSQYLDISFGRQIVAWGKSDFFRVTDRINPIDNRERVLDDLEFKRLPLLMTKLDAYPGSWRISGLLTHEIRYNRNPVYGSDFYPYTFPKPSRENKSNSLHNSTFGLTAGRSYHGFDIDLYLSSFLHEFDLAGLTPDVPQRRFSRVSMIGAATEKAIGYWLVKMETACLSGLEYYNLPGEDMTRLDFLAGADYTGFADTRVSFEAVTRYLFELNPEAAKRDDTPSKTELVWAFRFSRSFMRDTFKLVFLAYVGGIDFTDGSAEILTLIYRANDSLTTSGGYIFVHSGDNYLMKDVGDNDRVFLKLSYTF